MEIVTRYLLADWMLWLSDKQTRLCDQPGCHISVSLYISKYVWASVSSYLTLHEIP